MNKHTSVYLKEDLKDKIKNTGKPLNAVVTDALEAYFSGSSVNDDRIQEGIKNYLESEKMQAFLRSEINLALAKILVEKIPKYMREDLKTASKS
jgi:hypothetical protein